ncbi:MAG: GNAT family N-acetyltransferase [Christensenellaceae bacterium]|nr:GNAT family N-acetyltransferase [Christensenellaceae bacterium]
MIKILHILPCLSTDRLIIRAPKRRDFADMFLYSKNPECSRYCLWYPHKSRLDSWYFISMLKRENRRQKGQHFVIVVKDSGNMIGTIGITKYSKQDFSAEIGYSLSPDYWGRGFGTEALKSIICYSFNTLKLKRLVAICDTRNIASIKLLEKCGFKREEHIPKGMLLKGEYVDLYQYGFLAEDYNKAVEHG